MKAYSWPFSYTVKYYTCVIVMSVSIIISGEKSEH